MTANQNQNIFWVPTPYLESDDREQFRRWSEVGSSNPNVQPMASFDLIIDILSGQIDPLDLSIRIGIVPGKYSDVTTVLQELVPIIALNLSRFVKFGDINSTNSYMAKVAIPFSHFFKNLGISLINQRNSVIDSVHPIYQTFKDFPDIVGEKK